MSAFSFLRPTAAFLLAINLTTGALAADPASAVLPMRQDIVDACVLANDYWISHNGGATDPIEENRWDPAAYYTGNQRLTEVLRDAFPDEAAKKATYLERARLWAEAHDWERGPEGLSHADAHCCGQTYLDLYRLDPQSVRLHGVDGTTGIKPTLDFTVDNASANDDWSWIDAFYMAGPTLAKLDQTIGDSEGRDYAARLLAMYTDMKDRRGLFDTEAGLWYRDATAKTAVTENGKKEFWGRGNGWVIAGLVRVLDELGPEDADWDLYASMLQTMSAALLPLQQDDGFWRASLADPADSRWDNPETSGTAFITYAMTWGIHHAVLDEATYRPVVAKAWNGMVQTALHPDGKLGYIQGAGRAPVATTYDHTEDFGLGAFLLAGAELSLLAPEPPIIPNAGPDQSIADLDEDGVELVILDATGTYDPDGKVVSAKWLNGTETIATGFNPSLELALGHYTLNLLLLDHDGTPWLDPVEITVRGLQAPSPDAGEAQTVATDSFNGNASVTLDGSGTSDPDGRAASYQWLLGQALLATGIAPAVELPPGAHTLTLKITDIEGVSYLDTTTVTVEWLPAVTASTFQDPHVPANTLDHDLDTRWSAEGTQWIQYDLHMTTVVHKVSISFSQGDQRHAFLAIYVSADGAVWTPVFDGQSSGTTTGLEDFAFDDSLARHVRILGSGNSVNAWNSYTEVVVDGSLTNHDGNGNGLPDAWEQTRVGSLFADPHTDHDGDSFDATSEWLWGTDPLSPQSIPVISIDSDRAGVAQVRFHAPFADGIGYVGLKRHFTIEASLNLEDGSWAPAGVFDVKADDPSERSVAFPVGSIDRFLRVLMELQAAE